MWFVKYFLNVFAADLNLRKKVLKIDMMPPSFYHGGLRFSTEMVELQTLALRRFVWTKFLNISAFGWKNWNLVRKPPAVISGSAQMYLYLVGKLSLSHPQSVS